MLQESFSLIFLIREMEILKNILVKIWLPWKRQVTKKLESEFFRVKDIDSKIFLQAQRYHGKYNTYILASCR